MYDNSREPAYSALAVALVATPTCLPPAVLRADRTPVYPGRRWTENARARASLPPNRGLQKRDSFLARCLAPFASCFCYIPRRETRRRVKATRPSPRARPRRRAALRLPPPPKTARESRQRRNLSSPPSHQFLAYAASRFHAHLRSKEMSTTTLLPWLRHTQTRSRPTFITHTRHTNVLLPSLSLPLALCSFSTQSLLPPLLS